MFMQHSKKLFSPSFPTAKHEQWSNFVINVISKLFIVSFSSLPLLFSYVFEGCTLTFFSGCWTLCFLSNISPVYVAFSALGLHQVPLQHAITQLYNVPIMLKLLHTHQINKMRWVLRRGTGEELSRLKCVHSRTGDLGRCTSPVMPNTQYLLSVSQPLTSAELLLDDPSPLKYRCSSDKDVFFREDFLILFKPSLCFTGGWLICRANDRNFYPFHVFSFNSIFYPDNPYFKAASKQRELFTFTQHFLRNLQNSETKLWVLI